MPHLRNLHLTDPLFQQIFWNVLIYCACYFYPESRQIGDKCFKKWPASIRGGLWRSLWKWPRRMCFFFPISQFHYQLCWDLGNLQHSLGACWIVSCLTALISFTIQKCLYPQNCVSDHLFAKIRPFHSDGFATTVLMSDQSRTLAFFPLYYFLYLFQDLLILSPKYLYNWFLFFIPSTSSPVQAQIISFLNHYEVFLLSLCF